MKKDWKVGDTFYWNGCCSGYYTILAKAGDMILFDHFPIASCDINDIYESEEQYKKMKIEVLTSEIKEREEEIKSLSTSQKSEGTELKLSGSQSSPKLCPHCNMDISIRNPSGYCDHLYYPDYCEICKKREGKASDN